MADNRKLQLEAEVKDNTRAGFESIKTGAADMAKAVGQSSQAAGKAVDGIGAGAAKGADQFNRAEASIAASIKRSTVALQTLGKTASEKYTFKIDAQGLDSAKFEPYLEKLRQAEQVVGKVGTSAAQTAAALRQVPAQFTDIVVSLQAGQQPLTVLLQQGGQLKDMFGGAGAAAKAIGGYVVGLINPFNLLAAAVGVGAIAYNQGSKEADAYRASIITTGNAAGTTVAQLKEQAKAISAVIGTQGKAAESLAALASTGKVSADVMQQAGQAAVAWERTTGTAVGKTAEKFASLADTPLQSILKLNDGTNFLTESVYRQIKSLEQQGKTADAAALAQRTYADSLTSRAGDMERNLGSIETAWLKVKDAAKSAWDGMLNIGRQQTSQEQLAATNSQIAALENRLAAGSGFGDTAGGAATGRPDSRSRARMEAELAALGAKKAALEGVVIAADMSAAADAKRAEQMEAVVKWDKEGSKYLTDKVKMERELAAAREQGLAAGKSQAEIEQRLNAIRAQYAKKGGGENEVAAIKAKIIETERYLKLLKEQGSEADKMTEGERLVIKIKEELKTSISGVARAEKQQALAAAEQLAVVDRAVESEKKRIDGLKKARAEYAAVVDEAHKTALAINTQAAELEAANAVWGKGKVAIEEYRLALMQAKLAETEKGAESSYDPAYVAAIREQIAAQERKINQVRIAEFKELNQHADELLRNAKETAAVYEGEAELFGLSSVERAKLLAIRQVELKYAKELAAVDKSALTEDEKAVARSKLERARFIESQAASAKVVYEEWSRTAESISTAITDALMRGFESGKDFAKNLRDTVVNMFKTLILRPVISAIVNPIAGAISSAVSSAIGSSVLGSVGGSVLGGALGAGAIGWGTTGLANITGMFGGDALGVMAAGASGGFSSALGAAIAQVPVWGWIAAGLVAIAAAIDDSGTLHTGGSALYEDGKLVTSNTDGYGTGMLAVENSEAVRTAVGSIAKGIGGSLNALARLGNGGNYSVATGFADDSSKDGAWGALRISRDGQDIINWNNNRQSKWAPKEFADGEEGMKQYLKAVAKDVSKAIDEMGLPEWAMRIKKSNPTETLEDLTKVIEEIAAYPEKLLNSYGTSSQQLMTAWLDGLQSGDAAQAGRNVADMLVDSIEQSVYTNGMAKVFDIINMGIITPMLDALVTGAAVSEAVSEATIKATIEKATKAAEALAEFMNDPAFRDAMVRIRQTVAAAFGTAGASAPSRPSTSYQTDAQRQAERERVLRAAAEAQGAIIKAQIAAIQTEQKGYRAQIQSVQRYQETLRDQQAAVRETISALQAVADDLKSVIDTLDAGVRELTGAVDSTAKQSAAQAQAYLAQVLQTVKGGGSFPKADELSQNLDAAISGVNATVYQSLAQEQAAKLSLAAVLRDLKEQGVAKLDPVQQQIKLAEDQLAALQSMIDSAQDQIDGLQALVDQSQAQIDVLQEQYQTLQDQLNAALQTNSGIGLLNDTMMLVRNAIMDQTPSEDLVLGTMGAVYNTARGIGINARGELFNGGALRGAFEGHLGGGGAFVDVYNMAKDTGFTLAQLDAILGYPADYLESMARAANLPIFHGGTNYVPHTGFALLEKGEAVIPKQYNSAQGPGYTPPPSDAAAMQAAMDRLISEVKGLRAQVAETNRHAANTAKAVNGQPDAPMLVETV